MNKNFFKFPSTPHLMTLNGANVRSDKVLSKIEFDNFLSHEVVIEEKIDGANLGISLDINGSIFLQNRGASIQMPGLGQWKTLEKWLSLRIDHFFDCLTDRYILFGEWCYAQHSIFYNRLPDWFLGFDIYDKQVKRFLSVTERDVLFDKMKIFSVPYIAKGYFSLAQIQDLFSQSKFSDEPAEGLYFRINQGEELIQRAKIVRPSFIQSVETHWSRSALKLNKLK